MNIIYYLLLIGLIMCLFIGNVFYVCSFPFCKVCMSTMADDLPSLWDGSNGSNSFEGKLEMAQRHRPSECWGPRDGSSLSQLCNCFVFINMCM